MVDQVGHRIFSGYAPADGPLGVAVSLDFSSIGVVEGDLIIAENMNAIAFVQAAWIDNASNPVALDFNVQLLGQRIRVPANKQGVFPIFGGALIRYRATTTPGAGIVIPVIFLNVPMPFAVW